MSKKKKELISAWTFGDGLRIMAFKDENNDVTGNIEGQDGFKTDLPEDKAKIAAQGYVNAKVNEGMRKYLDEVEKEFNLFRKKK